MKYHQLSTQRQSSAKRAGRGIAAGRGKTAGRGTKGQGSRKSGGVRPGFEGGQMPLYMRLPKLRGFKSRRQPVTTITVGQLDQLKPVLIDSTALAEAGLIAKPFTAVKLLAGGDLKTKKTVRLSAASAGAVAAIKKAGGNFTVAEPVRKPASRTKTS
ncbi:50S ribosomal protein L15 [Candidatus Saccharibacteria bacterium]|nr:50S ribosomal protein L15 [Candidatus Saccharibacteria bacterium]